MLRIVLLALVVAAAVRTGHGRAANADGPLVQTAYGTVRGTRNAEGYSSFTGIRYAQAPTGRKRFLSASPPPSWEGIFDANRNDIACPQIESVIGNAFIGVEDCLTLNIYTPDTATPENPVPVMVYFYGGGFVTGSVIMYGEEFLMKHDVIVVLVNFRVSALGHLCLRHELIPGNAAFKDQVAALRWLQQNIAEFGGDPDNVTIFGHSAGAASVDLLTLSPMANGLFHKAVPISGSARAFWAVNPDPIGYATTMAEKYLDYDGNSFEDLVEFYLNVDNEKLATATTQYFMDLHHRSVPVAACVENIFPGIEAFLTKSPADIIITEQYTPIPKIYIVTNKEYVNMVVPTEIENAEHLMQNLETHLPNDLVFQSNQQRTQIANRIRDFYVKEDMSMLESYIDYKSDTMFYYAVARAARKHTSTSTAPIYMLEFTYESERQLPRLPQTAGITGAAHADDMLYLIFSMYIGLPLSPADQLTIDRYTTLLTNFAKYSNPTPDPNDLQWLPMTENQFRYLQFGSEVTPLIAPHPEAIAFWDQIYNEVTPNRLVQTEQGWVRGTHNSEESYFSFTGIRYATVPTGRDRYAAPLPAPSFDGIFEANQNNIICPQMWGNMFIGIEDCLHLNVYKPDVASSENKKAVIVYFYGGSYLSGSKVLYGPDHLMSQDVVLVIANFRVGVLGLLCLKHELIPGNAAFKDQVAVLRWVQQNIAAFGGDPDNVTIMGHSSGGASVDLLTLSPMTDGLFHRSVTISASSQAVWAVNFNPVEHAFIMAKKYLDFEDDDDDIEALIELYLNAGAEDLATAVSKYHADVILLSLPVAACVENSFPNIEAFLKDTPDNILASEEYVPLPKIYAYTNREYVNMLTPAEIGGATSLMENVELILPINLNLNNQPDSLRTLFGNRVRNFYIKDDVSSLESYIDYRSDTVFFYAITKSARKRVTSDKPVYVLEFTYESDMRLPRFPETDGITGAGHGDDAFFLIFPTPPEITVTTQDQLTIDRYTTLMSNFAKYSNPTPDVDDIQWPPVTPNQIPYLQLGSEVAISQAPRAEAMQLWDEIYAEAETPHVQIAQGLVRGTHHPEAGYYSFTGIRYGKIPTGRNRYASPSPPPTWKGVFIADQDNIFCPQVWNGEYVGTEDCLVVNVYTPDKGFETNSLPVIVYIHGGGFFGSSSAYFGPDQLLSHDVVLVTVNYRLGPLGHLCLGHELIPGNAAFKDQVAALRWVKNNIASFGGDPESVTIMGQSSGGVSVDLLTLSPMTRNLFKGVISMSGAARAFWAIVADPVAVARTMAETHMDFNGDSLEDLVEFYLAADVEALAKATSQFYQEFGYMYLPFAGCIEQEFPDTESFLTDTPANIFASGEYTSIPTIYTVTNKEYVNMITPQEINNITQIIQHIGEYLPGDLILTPNQRSDIANRVRTFYVNDQRSPLEGYIDFMSDTMFYFGLARSARERQAKSSSPVYVMEFAFESNLRVPRLPAVDGITGAGHGDDVLFVIARIGADAPLTAADRLTIERYGQMFSNFAKHGNPTPEDEPVAWQPMTEEQFYYLNLGTQLTVSESPNAAAIALWDDVYASSSARLLPTLFAIILSAILLIFNLR